MALGFALCNGLVPGSLKPLEAVGWNTVLPSAVTTLLRCMLWLRFDLSAGNLCVQRGEGALYAFLKHYPGVAHSSHLPGLILVAGQCHLPREEAQKQNSRPELEFRSSWFLKPGQ